MTNNPDNILTFNVNDLVLGSSTHSSHKIIECSLHSQKPTKNMAPPHNSPKKPFNRVSEDNIDMYSENLCKAFVNLLPYLNTKHAENLSENPKSHANAIFRKFLNVFDTVKHTSLGRPPPKKAGNLRPNMTRKLASRELDQVALQITETLQKLGRSENADRSDLLSTLDNLQTQKSDLISKMLKTEYNDFLSKIEALDFENASRHFFLEVKKITDRKPYEENPISLDDWASFFEKLYTPNSKNTPYPPSLTISELNQTGPPELSQDISFSEVEIALKKAARHKSPGADLVKIEELAPILDDPEALEALHKLILLFWKLEHTPTALKKSILVPFLKNPDKNKLDPANYRPIALLSNFLKLYHSVLDARLSRFLETRGL